MLSWKIFFVPAFTLGGVAIVYFSFSYAINDGVALVLFLLTAIFFVAALLVLLVGKELARDRRQWHGDLDYLLRRR